MDQAKGRTVIGEDVAIDSQVNPLQPDPLDLHSGPQMGA